MNFDLKANALGLVLKTIGIEPTLDGLLTAFKFNPPDVYECAAVVQAKAPGFIEWAQKEGPALVKKLETVDQRIANIEALTLAIAHRLGISHVNGVALPAMKVHVAANDAPSAAPHVKPALVAPEDAQEIAEAALAEASGRS